MADQIALPRRFDPAPAICRAAKPREHAAPRGASVEGRHAVDKARPAFL